MRGVGFVLFLPAHVASLTGVSGVVRNVVVAAVHGSSPSVSYGHAYVSSSWSRASLARTVFGSAALASLGLLPCLFIRLSLIEYHIG